VAEAGKGGLVAGIRNIPTFINQVKAETSKVVWPTRRETVMTAVMVVAMTHAPRHFLLRGRLGVQPDRPRAHLARFLG